MDKRVFMLFDSRAAHGMGTEDALVLDTAEALAEARREAARGDHGPVAVYSYRLEGKNMVDERFEFHTCGG